MISMRHAVALMGTGLVLAGPTPLLAQGVVRGAQEGASVGNKAAGPVGGVVGGAVGGVFGGVAGGVKGVLGIPQSTATTASRPQNASRTGTLSRSSIRAELIGRPLNWRTDDGSQSGVTVFYSDNTASLTKSSLKTGPEDAGRWTMRGNRTCITWEKINPGVENCSTWTRTGPKTFRDSDGITFATN